MQVYPEEPPLLIPVSCYCVQEQCCRGPPTSIYKVARVKIATVRVLTGGVVRVRFGRVFSESGVKAIPQNNKYCLSIVLVSLTGSGRLLIGLGFNRLLPAASCSDRSAGRDAGSLAWTSAASHADGLPRRGGWPKPKQRWRLRAEKTLHVLRR
jgi:hypothetical protein